MKTPTKIITLFAALLILGGDAAYGARFETLRVSAQSTKTFAVSTSDLVTITGVVLADGGARVSFKMPAEDDLNLTIATDEVRSGTFIGQAFTGLNEVAATGTSSTTDLLVTFKIQTAEEVASVTPPNVLLLPEGLEGDFDLIIEESTDLVAWSPFLIRGITADGPRRFYRARIVRRVAP